MRVYQKNLNKIKLIVDKEPKGNPKMKVYLVIEADYDSWEIYGICSSQEKAESMIEQLEKKRVVRKKRLSIDEYELDKCENLPESKMA